ncbi:MAG: Rpn family recombination-promoting nuclease/putative transposase [Oscillospiraceae bacterium]|jgi:predicted transposase/invertase (TIGR01784 family)|nr:Rpn family recombination-promoting nuclease/putative transposase [Oscillospiraceae bacterium]
MPDETRPEISKTVGLLKELSMDEKVQIMYEAREKARRDHEARIRFAENEGLARGIERNKREIAKKLLGLHAPLDMILEATGLPLSDIQSLQRQ